MVDQQTLLDTFEYRDGFLYWRKRPLHHFGSQRACDISNGSHAVGSPAYSLGGNGYYYVQFSLNGVKKQLLMHRVIWVMFNGEIPEDLTVDHRDTIPTNCTIENLRVCSQEQNMMNSSTPVTNTSGVKGVSWMKRACKWRAYISSKNKQIHLGLFDNIKDAENAIYEYRESLRREYANHN